ncbi:MAG: hypothetical protein NC120_12400, partial [Ruminococcus sp.]|nr:hypothetical protein [Ruminococcus sp.]
MIKIENTSVHGFEPALRGMRNPMNSWDNADSIFIGPVLCEHFNECPAYAPDEEYGDVCMEQEFRRGAGTEELSRIGENDHRLAMRLAGKGSVRAKYRRMITVYADITAPLYWWKEFDTYKVGTVANSCSTMHK